MGQKNISSSFVCSIVEDGVSQPSYIQTQESWSNDAVTSSSSTCPATDPSAAAGTAGSTGYPKDSDWSDGTPARNNRTYLWRRSRTMTLDETTRQYVAGAWSYQRLSGENGTSINVKGHVATVSDLNNIPSPSVDDAYVVDADGHLYTYMSSGTWQDIGQFKGEAGDTYYLHTAWASDTDDSGTIPSPSTSRGQTSVPNKSSVTGFSISPFSGASWMGIMVDKTVTDSTQGNLYTWDYVKGEKGETGSQGKMGRNLWYAGMWNDEDVSGQSFVVTDTQAPYVNTGTENAPNCKMWVGGNGTHQFPTTTGAYDDSSVWASMETNFKYLITKALFSDFANLGSAIFNKDYMMSRYGEVVAYGRAYAPSNANLYKYADPNDMGAKTVSRKPSSFSSQSFSNSSYNESQKISLGTFTLGYMYMLAAKFTVTSGNTVAFKFAKNSSEANILNGGSEYTLSSSNSNVWQFKYLQATSSELTSDTYLLYYRLASGTTATIVDGYKSRAKFRPNIYADWYKGFFSSLYGRFKNVVIEGVFNNLITEIDPQNSVNTDMIISYSVSGYTRKCLDVLRCGTIVRIKSLPSSWGSTDTLRLPYFVSDTNYERTYTYLGTDGTKLTSARQITADEMRMLVGRKLVIILDDAFGLEQSVIKSHKVVPSGLESHTSASYNKHAIIDIANGQPHIADSTSVSSLDYNDVKLNYRKSVYMECRLVRDVTNSRYCYIWTNTTADDSNGTGEPIDTAWT